MISPEVVLPPFQLDIRIAESPLVGMRFLLDGRATDLDEVAVQLDEQARAAVEQRAQVRSQLKTSANQRQLILAAPDKYSRNVVAEQFAAALVLCGEMGALEERVKGLRSRADGLRQEAIALRQLADALGGLDAAGGVEVDAEATRYNRALRQLQQWVGDDQDAIAQQVTDTALQSLASATVSIELMGRLVAEASPRAAAAEFHNCTAAIDAAREATDRLVDDLRPPLLAGGLNTALQRLARCTEPAAGRFLTMGEARELPVAVELALYRIAQEAISNAIRHGRPERVDIVLSMHSSRVLLVISDDGDGFDAPATEARLGRTEGHGLLAMRQRAELIGAAFELRSMVGAGTEVRVSVDASI